MAPEKSAPSETQEQSIKSRKHQLYDAEPTPGPAEPGKKIKTVEDYLRETPATKLSSGLKASLWAAGGLVVVLFFGVFLISHRKPNPTYASQTPLVAKASEVPNQRPTGPAPEAKSADNTDHDKGTPEPAAKPKADQVARSKDDQKAVLSKDGKFLALDLRQAATAVTTKGMFDNKSSDKERLIFPDWKPKKVEGVPFELIDPKGDQVKNAIILNSSHSGTSAKFPTSVEIPCRTAAKAIHLLSGVNGWGWGFSKDKKEPTVSMIVRLHYADGRTEDHKLKDGVHFTDYYRDGEVPGSKLAFRLREQQIRYLAVKPRRPSVINTIELVKGDDDTAPIVMAMTAEVRKDELLAGTGPDGKMAWHAAVDPAGTSFEIPAGQELSVQVPLSADGGLRVLYPSTPSPYVAVGDNLADVEAREIWDLRTRKRNGTIRGNLKIFPPYALSADGSFFAARTTKEAKKDDKDKDKDKDKKQPSGVSIGVWSFKTGQEVKIFKIELGTVDYLDFAGDGQIVAADLDSQMFQLWNIEKAEKTAEFEVPGPVDRESLALSPGRKFLAMTSVREGSLWVYELAGGTLVAGAALPKDGGPNSGCAGMCFSNDGKELAAVFDPGGRPRILCWDVATGKQAYDRTIDPRYGLGRVRDDQGRGLEWLPDRSGWLVYGYAIIDRQSSQRVWTLPLYYPDFPPAPRRMLDGDRALLVWGGSRTQPGAVRGVVIPKDKIASARQIARSGGSAVDAVLPPVKASDASTKHPVPAPATAWSVTPDPAPRPARPLLSRPIALKNRIYEVQQALCSGPEAPQAVVAFRTGDRNDFTGNILAAGQSFSVERYDLATGKRLAQNELPAVCELLGFSPDSSRLMLRDSDKRERLDLYATTDLKLVCGWRPYEKETGTDRAVTWAAFLDQHRVLTSNPSGKLVLWAVPDCRVIYAVPEACQGAPILCPGRKHLAGFAGGASGGVIRFFDAASGQRLGEVTAPSADDGGKPGLLAGAFRADGKQFIALLNGNQLVRIDLASGKILSEFHSPAQPGTLVEWCGDRHVLVNNFSLVDLDRQWEVWRYAGAVPCFGSPDNRRWAVVEPYANSPAYLAGFDLPEKRLDKIVAMVADKKAPALLRAGGSVSLKVEASGPPKDDGAFSKSVFEQFANQLRANDISVQDGQPVTLVVKADEVETGEKVEAYKLVPGMKKDSDEGKKPVSIRVLEYEIVFQDANGKATLEPKQTINLYDFGPITAPEGTKDPGKYLSTELWKIARSRLANVVLPPFAARQPEGVVRFPGFSNLGNLLK